MLKVSTLSFKSPSFKLQSYKDGFAIHLGWTKVYFYWGVKITTKARAYFDPATGAVGVLIEQFEDDTES